MLKVVFAGVCLMSSVEWWYKEHLPENNLQSSWTFPMALSSSDFISLFIMSNTSIDKSMAFLFWPRCFVKPDKVVLLSTDEVRSEASRGSWAACCIADNFPVVERKIVVYGYEQMKTAITKR